VLQEKYKIIKILNQQRKLIIYSHHSYRLIEWEKKGYS